MVGSSGCSRWLTLSDRSPNLAKCQFPASVSIMGGEDHFEEGRVNADTLRVADVVFKIMEAQEKFLCSEIWQRNEEIARLRDALWRVVLADQGILKGTTVQVVAETALRESMPPGHLSPDQLFQIYSALLASIQIDGGVCDASL